MAATDNSSLYGERVAIMPNEVPSIGWDHIGHNLKIRQSVIHMSLK